MYKSTMSFAKGVGVGLLAFAAYAMYSSHAGKKHHRRMKHNTNRAMHKVGEMIDNVQYVFR